MDGTTNKIHAVTGAFGYSGKYITKKLTTEVENNGDTNDVDLEG